MNKRVVALATISAAVIASYASSALSRHHVDYNLIGEDLQGGIAVTAQAFPPKGEAIVPGAIICSDYDQSNFLLEVYEQHYGDLRQEAATHGRARLIRGPDTPEPDIRAHGCFLAPPGTKMLWSGQGLPVVKAFMPDGDTVTGVTLMPMMDIPESPQEIAMREASRAAASSSSASEAAASAASSSSWSEEMSGFADDEELRIKIGDLTADYYKTSGLCTTLSQPQSDAYCRESDQDARQLTAMGECEADNIWRRCPG